MDWCGLRWRIRCTRCLSTRGSMSRGSALGASSAGFGTRGRLDSLRTLWTWAHLDFVHPGLLGSPGDTVIDPYDVETDDGTVIMRYTKRSVGPETFADGEETVRHEVRVEMPYTFTLLLRGERGLTTIWGLHHPIDSGRCALWRFESRNHSLDTPDQEFIDFLDVLLPQDQAIIESQRPDMVPVDLTEELHVKVADAGAIAYRRLLRDELGVAYV